MKAARTASRVSLEGRDDDDEDDLGDKDQDVEDTDWATGQTEKKDARRSRPKKRKRGGGGDSGGSEGDDDEDNGVWLKVPRDILKITAPTAVRMGLSHGDHVTLLASFLRASDADLDDFTLSYSSSHRKRKEATQEIYFESREQFRDLVTEEDWALTLHFDEVELADTIGRDEYKAQNKKQFHI